ncbi:SMP-30/gluconolactonase/LRE family protein [Ilumatobacter sp.]|uniref:SMP-30/gluconolactonase/LRE family protein n=1 Tax=Ilumatobacter sp. TaxID=1967498 RepID=UPI003AF69E7A
MRALVDPGALLHHLADGCTWAEGPVYLAESDTVLWSDVRSNRRMRLEVTTGTVTEADRPANFCNGHTLDLLGSVIACEHGTRSVVRLAADGSREVVADRFDGKRFNSPNDVVVSGDGSVWFTDPTYGIDSDDEGHAADSEIGSNNVYRVDAVTGDVTAEVTDMVQPNGLAFSLDERSLYVSDTGVSHVDGGPRHLRCFDVSGGRVVGGGLVVATCPEGVFDGFRLDADGRIWASGRQGVHCYEPDGTLLGTIRLPEVCANLVFGGDDRSTLFMTADTSLYSLRVRVRGADAP